MIKSILVQLIDVGYKNWLLCLMLTVIPIQWYSMGGIRNGEMNSQVGGSTETDDVNRKSISAYKKRLPTTSEMKNV